MDAISSWDCTLAKNIPHDLDRHENANPNNSDSNQSHSDRNQPGFDLGNWPDISEGTKKQGSVWSSSQNDVRGNDVLGWGTPCPNPATNAGTEGWVASKTTSGQWNPENKPAAWGQQQSTKFPTPEWNQSAGGAESKTIKNYWPSTEINQSNASAWGTSEKEASGIKLGLSSNSAAWGVLGGMNRQVTQTTDIQIPVQNTWAQAAGRGLSTSNTSASNTNKSIDAGSGSCHSASRDEVIAHAVNSRDGWGRTPIRQDTAWDIDAGPPQNPTKAPTTSATSTTAASEMNTSTTFPWSPLSNGTTVWNASKESEIASNSTMAVPSLPAPIGTKDPVKNNENLDCRMGQNTKVSPIGTQLSLSPVENNDVERKNSASNVKPSSSSSPWNISDKKSLSEVVSPLVGGNLSWNESSNNENLWESPAWTEKSSGSQSNSWSEKTTINQPDVGSESNPPGLNGLRRNSSSSFSGGWAGDMKLEQVSWSGIPKDQSASFLDGSSSNSASNQISGQDPSQTWRAVQNSTSAANCSRQSSSKSDDDSDPFWSPTTNVTSQASNKSWGDSNDDIRYIWNPSPLLKTMSGLSDSSWPDRTRQQSNSSWTENSNVFNDEKKVSANMTNLTLANKKNCTENQQLLLQQFVDAGFRKEDIQNALLSNKMNIEQTAANLLLLTSRKRQEQDLMNNKKMVDLSLQSVDMADVGAFANQQTSSIGGIKIGQNFHLPLSNLGCNSSNVQLPLQLSSSTNSIQMASQHQQQHQQTMSVPSVQTIQQQIIQSQMLQQLQMAVQAGHIPPQLLSLQPTPALIIGLYHLLQLQNTLQHLQAQQQLIVQGRNSKTVSRFAGSDPALDQLIQMISKIKQQISQQQVQILQLHKLQIPPPPLMPQSTGPQPSQNSLSLDQNKDLLKNFALNMQLKDNMAAAPHWRLPPPTNNSVHGFVQPHSTDDTLDKMIGLKPAQLSHSNLHPYDTWTTSSMPAWPNNFIAPNPAKESTFSGQASLSPNTPAGDALGIEEFIPGKPWQGSIVKPADDDPFSAPSSDAQQSKSGIPDSTSTMLSWPLTGPETDQKGSVWSPETYLSNAGLAKNCRSPPGLGSGNTWQQQQPFSRSVSWTPRPSQAPVSSNALGSRSLLLRNLPSQGDVNFLKALCHKHGQVQFFLHDPVSRQIVVAYRSKEDAIVANRALMQNPILAGAHVVIDVISDADFALFADQMSVSLRQQPVNSLQQNKLWYQPVSQPVSASPRSSKIDAPYWNSAPILSNSIAGGFGRVWEGQNAEDHSLALPVNLLGGQ